MAWIAVTAIRRDLPYGDLELSTAGRRHGRNRRPAGRPWITPAQPVMARALLPRPACPSASYDYRMQAGAVLPTVRQPHVNSMQTLDNSMLIEGQAKAWRQRTLDAATGPICWRRLASTGYCARQLGKPGRIFTAPTFAAI